MTQTFPVGLWEHVIALSVSGPFSDLGYKKMDVEVQEKQDALGGFLRSLESDDWRVLVNFDSPANSII